MLKRFAITCAVLLVVFGGIFGWYLLRQHFIKQYFANFKAPPMVVSAVKAKSVTWYPYLESVGTLDAVDGVEISSEVSGQVTKIYFKSGDLVKKGQPLIQLDDASEQAQLKQVVAQLKLAKLNDNRNRRLLADGAAPQSVVDDSSSQFSQLLANEESLKAVLDKKLIRAPFSGRIGIKKVNIGQYLSPGVSCASLQANDFLNVIFSIPQKDLNQIKLNQAVQLSIDSYPGKLFHGNITAIDSEVDENTRTVQLQAYVKNNDGLLMPGMFSDIKVVLSPRSHTIVVPRTAITYSLYGSSVFVVALENKKNEEGQELGVAHRIFVKTGEESEDQVVILDGIKENDIVLDSGQLKIAGDKGFVAISNPL